MSNKFFASLIAAFLFSAVSAPALTLQYSTVVNNGGVNYLAGEGGDFSLSKFNPALGTLLSVSVEIIGNS